MASEAGGAMYEAAAAAGEGAQAGAEGEGPTSETPADDGVVDAEVVDEGPAEETK